MLGVYISLQFLESISYTSEDIRSIVLTRPKGMFGKTGFQIYVPFGTLILKLVAYGKPGPSFCKWWSSNPGCKGWTVGLGFFSLNSAASKTYETWNIYYSIFCLLLHRFQDHSKKGPCDELCSTTSHGSWGLELASLFTHCENSQLSAIQIKLEVSNRCFFQHSLK